MKDFPVFTTGAGAAGLILKEIPYRSKAYVKLHDTCDPQLLLEECCDFCRAVGAKQIYATGHPALESYPLHTAVWEMSRLRQGLPETDAALFPVQQQTLGSWRALYNDRMRSVPNSATMTLEEGNKMLDRGDGYFVHKDGRLLGIGIAAGGRIDAIVSAVAGAGQEVLFALNHALTDERVVVEVASANERAVNFYKKLGFVLTKELSRWYRIY